MMRCPPPRSSACSRLPLTAALVAGTVAPALAAEGSSFRDDFDGLDRERWYVSDGWSNGPHQNCVWSADEVAADGALRLTYSPIEARDDDAPRETATETSGDGAGEETHAFACGEIQSNARFGHGTYEARLKPVERSGFNSAFFTYVGPTQNEPHDEIDVEVLGKDASRVQFNSYVAGEGGNEALVPVPGGPDGFAHYAFVWEPDRLRYFVDGIEVHEVTDPTALPERPMKIFASLWASETFDGWLGRFDPPDGPVEMEVDWIAFTALGDPCAFPVSVACGL